MVFINNLIVYDSSANLRDNDGEDDDEELYDSAIFEIRFVKTCFEMNPKKIALSCWPCFIVLT